MLNRDRTGLGDDEVTESLLVGMFSPSIVLKSLLTNISIISNRLWVWWAVRGPIVGEIWPKHRLNRKLVFLRLLHWGFKRFNKYFSSTLLPFFRRLLRSRTFDLRWVVNR